MTDTVFFESSPSFSVPCDVVDKHLDAPETELRLLLLLLRNPNAAFLKNDLLARLNVDEKRLDEAFRYWVRQGILFEIEGKYSLSRPRLTASDFVKYDPDTIARRMEEDEGLRYLYTEAERALKKPLTSEDASAVLALVDWCGLLPDVVALLLRYGTGNGMSLRQIQKVGIRWADGGVNTFDRAEEWIRKESEKKQAVNRVAARLGILGTRALTDGEEKAFLRWTGEYNFDLDMIGAAYEATVKGTGKYSYAYLDKILTKWHEAGYRTPDDVRSEAKPAAKTVKKGRAQNPKRPEKTNADAMDWAWQIAGETDD